MKVVRKLSHEELFSKFKEINDSVEILNWQPLIADECRSYAKPNQPIIRVDLKGGNWLRVYVAKESNEINWY
ncbi:MAG: hypothetical protein ACLUCZ_17395 [Thomasclavelia ramosa]